MRIARLGPRRGARMARLMAVALTIALAGRAAGAQTCSTTVVSRDELIAAMREEQGYNLVATTNWARFQTYVFLRLARAARARDSSGRKPILIRAEDWFWNYVAVAGLNPDSAPLGTRRAHDLGQDMQLDYNPAHVLSDVRRGPRSEEHTSELQSPFLISYAVFCLKKKKKIQYQYNPLRLPRQKTKIL